MSTESSSQPDRSAVQRVVDRIVREPAYRRELLEDPGRALWLLGIVEEDDGPEVTGHRMAGDKCGLSCNSGTCRQTCNGGPTCTKSQYMNL